MIKHGTNRGWEAGCREHCCVNARKVHQTKRRRLAQSRGIVREDSWVSSERAVLHLNKLVELGYGYKVIARFAGMSPWTIKNLLYGERKVIALKTEKKVLAIPIEGFQDVRYTDSTGTIRRLRALYWMGYAYYEIAEVFDDFPLTGTYIRELTSGAKSPGQVKIETRDAVKKVYNYFLVRDVPKDNPGNSRKKRRLKAEKMGWHPPGVWRNIDDPHEKPRP